MKMEKEKQGPFDNISLVGKHYLLGETSVKALGLVAYTKITGQPPEKMHLGNSVHRHTLWLQPQLFL